MKQKKRINDSLCNDAYICEVYASSPHLLTPFAHHHHGRRQGGAREGEHLTLPGNLKIVISIIVYKCNMYYLRMLKLCIDKFLITMKIARNPYNTKIKSSLLACMFAHFCTLLH